MYKISYDGYLYQVRYKKKWWHLWALVGETICLEWAIELRDMHIKAFLTNESKT